MYIGTENIQRGETMLTFLTILCVALGVLGYCLFFTRIPFRDCYRNAFLTFLFCAIMSIPIGQYEEFTYTKGEVLETSKYLYVVPCEHCLDGEATEVHITPPYTRLGTMVLCDDLTQIAYCSECYARREALQFYFAKR